jgi:hypothetical protein
LKRRGWGITPVDPTLEKESDLIPLLLILLLLAVLFGGFFVFSLKVAVVVALVLLVVGLFGGWSYRGRRAAL